MNTSMISRRNFLKRTGGTGLACAFPYVVAPQALGAAGRPSASSRITIGCIGVGSRGTAVMRGFIAQKDAQVVALCDVKSNVLQDRKNLVDKFYHNNDCKTYGDFRDLTARKDIDMCIVATCDHWHVLCSLAAVRSGKDVYMEKPMGLSLQQDQMMRREVKRFGRIFQFGTQQRSDAKFRQACEIAINEKIGKLHTINVWSPGSSSGGDPTPIPVPSWLNYNLWLGPAPYTPYTKDRCSNRLWWFISDYALGFIAGWGIHPLDIALWGGGDRLKGPWEIEGTGQFPTTGVCNTAMNWRITCKCAGGVTINFAGNPYPDKWKKRYHRTTSHGTAFEGSTGWVHVDRAGINAQPQSLLTASLGPNDIHLYRSSNHARNMLDSVKSRRPTVCPVTDAVRADMFCQVSDIAIRLGRKLKFDPVAEKFIDDDEANQHLTRPMRSPWHL